MTVVAAAVAVRLFAMKRDVEALRFAAVGRAERGDEPDQPGDQQRTGAAEEDGDDDRGELGAELGEAVYTAPGQIPMSDEDARPFAGLAALRDKLEILLAGSRHRDNPERTRMLERVLENLIGKFLVNAGSDDED